MSQRIIDALSATKDGFDVTPFIVRLTSPFVQSERRRCVHRETWQSKQAAIAIDKLVFPHQDPFLSTCGLGMCIQNSSAPEIIAELFTTPELRKAAELINRAWASFNVKLEREHSSNLTKRLHEILVNQ